MSALRKIVEWFRSKFGLNNVLSEEEYPEAQEAGNLLVQGGVDFEYVFVERLEDTQLGGRVRLHIEGGEYQLAYKAAWN